MFHWSIRSLTTASPSVEPLCPKTQPDSRFRSLVVKARGYLSQALLESPALFEIRHIRTGELAVSSPFHDGTFADRIARTLGRDWRVFRVNPVPSAAQSPKLLSECPTTTQDLVALNRNLANGRPAAQEPSLRAALPANVQLKLGEMIVSFPNAAELEETLAALSRMVKSDPQAFDAVTAEAPVLQLR